MALNALNIPDEDYKEAESVRIKARDFFEGELAVKKNEDGDKYLIKGHNEEDDAYERRKLRAFFDPFIANIVEVRQSLLFRREAKRDIKKVDDKFIHNVDLQGTEADLFFKQVTEDAQVDGISWVLVTRRNANVEADISKADEKLLNIRPYFAQIPASNVIRTSRNDDGELDWVVIQTQAVGEPSTAEPWGEISDTVDEWHVWTRNEWIIYRRATEAAPASTNAGGNQSNFVEYKRGSHPVGRVPLVPFFGYKRYPNRMVGLPVCHNILGHVMAVYNRESDRDWYLQVSGHPIPILISPEEPEEFNAAGGVWLKSQPQVHQPEVTYLETSGNAFDAMETSITSLIHRIFLLSLKQARSETKQVQAADSQREDRKMFSSSIMAASRSYEAAERACWEMFLAWDRVKFTDESLIIEYARDFDDEQITSEMVKVFSELQLRGQIPLEAFFNLLKRAEILKDDWTFEQFQAMIEKENALDSSFGLQPPDNSGRQSTQPKENENLPGDAPGNSRTAQAA